MKRIIIIVLFVAFCCSCGHRIEGDYSVMGYTLTRKAITDSINVTSVPKFHFEGNRVIIYRDFNFGYFVDSVYSYTYRGSRLLLNGTTHSKELICEPVSGGYELFDLDDSYLQAITILLYR